MPGGGKLSIESAGFREFKAEKLNIGTGQAEGGIADELCLAIFGCQEPVIIKP